nr:unnamed protein product [Spirometra erinaceieuropaei]
MVQAETNTAWKRMYESQAENLIVLSDFNARVGTDRATWGGGLIPYGLDGFNDNGLSRPPIRTCAEHRLVLTDILFLFSIREKTTWMYPRSRHWHLLGYLLARRRNKRNVLVTKAILDAGEWTDHRLVISEMRICLQPRWKPQVKRASGKLNIAFLSFPSHHLHFSNKLAQRLANLSVVAVAATIEETPWRTHGVSCGTQCSRLHCLSSVAHVADMMTDSMKMTPSSTTCSPRRTACKSLRKPLHQRQQSGLLLKSPPCSTEAAREVGHLDGPQAEEIQSYADRNEWKNCFSTIKAAYEPYSPRRHKSYSVGPSTSEASFTISDVAIAHLSQVEINFDLDLSRFLHEIIRAVQQLSSGKGPRSDAIPAEI